MKITILAEYLTLNHPHIHKIYSPGEGWLYLTNKNGSRIKLTNQTSITELQMVAEKIESDFPMEYRKKKPSFRDKYR